MLIFMSKGELMMQKDISINLNPVYDFSPKEGIMPINQRDKYALLSWGEIDGKDLRIFIDVNAFIRVRRHAKKRVDREVGGFLVGKAMREKENTFIQITDIIEVKEIQHKSGEFIFTHEVWKMIDSIMSEYHQDKQLLGWYHTHPGLGIFLSPEDKFIQSNFFNHFWQTALVLDPLTQHQGFYYLKNDKLVNLGFYIYTSKENTQVLKRLTRELEVAEKREKCGRYRAHHVFG